MGTWAIAATLLLGACHSDDKFDEALAQFTTFRDRMCACTDVPCVDKVQTEWRSYRDSIVEKVGRDAKPNDAQEKKGRALQEEMRVCRNKLAPKTPAP